jgi:carboxyl-terminal processing protease
VIRIGILSTVFLFGHLCVVPAAEVQLDQTRLNAVYAEALTFMLPRVLEPVSAAELTSWGLQGLNSLDPSLIVMMRQGRLQLFQDGKLLSDITVPANASPLAWAGASVQLTAAGFAASNRVRGAGTQKLIMSFFDQMFSRLDPYSRYLPPTDADQDREQRAGKASLGLTIGEQGNTIVVTTVVRDGPAAMAGLRPGDVLISVDDRRVMGQDADALNALLMGPKQSVISLSWRDKDGRPRRALLTRAIVPPETVFVNRTGDVLVLRITSFSGSTASHVAQSVQDAQAEKRPLSGIVLDLRDNRGGLLRQAVTAADTFLPAGPIATTIGRDPDAVSDWRSTEGELAENVPLVILVDGRTASAAEVMAAALSDRGRAVVVGSATVGKGMVQTIDPLPDGGELFVTWSQLIAPLGWPIQGIGLIPQVCTSLGKAALMRQLKDLTDGTQPMASAIFRSKSARLPSAPSQILEIRAPCPSALGSSEDLEVARQLISNPAAYATALLPPFAAQ